MKQHQVLSDALSSLGVDVIFGLIGDANLFQVDDWTRRHAGRFISVAHENAAVLAAGGYSSVTDRVGIATITHGPAVTNTVTALVDLVRAGLPAVVLAGSTDPHQPGHLQLIDQAAVVSATGARYERSYVPREVGADLARSMDLAMTERRPVVLEVPAHHQWADVDEPAATERALHAAPLAPDPDLIEEAVGLLASARRPVVIGGRGARHARAELIDLASRLGAPVATSVRGKGLFVGHPHDLGIMGNLSHQAASDVFASADVVVAFGAALNDFTTAGGGWLEGKRLVHVDTNPAALGRWRIPDVAIAADAASSAAAMASMLVEAEVPPSTFASSGLAARLSEFARDRRLEAKTSPEAQVSTLGAMHLVDDVVDADRVLVVDDGRFMLSAFTDISVASPSDYVHGASFASIGMSMGLALGASAAAPERTVLVVTGDGGFINGGLAEFNTAVRHGMRILVVVMNDGAYGAEHMQFVARDLDPALSCLGWPPFDSVATALGGVGCSARTEGELSAALREVKLSQHPALVDVLLDPLEVPGLH